MSLLIFAITDSGELQDSEHSPAATRDVREILSGLPDFEISALTELPQNQKCGEHDLPCDHTSIFRTITGWCNNLRAPNKGKAFTVFKRLLPAIYNDGMRSIRAFFPFSNSKLLMDAGWE
jgi:peroxidase